MKSYANNEKVAYGVYASTDPIDLRMVGEDGERLDGKPHARYTRLPTWMLIGLAPALGGVFVFAFPALVIVAVAYAAAKMVTKPAQEAARQHAYVAQMRWSPAASYLQNEDGQEGQTADDELAAAVLRQRAKETSPQS